MGAPKAIEHFLPALDLSKIPFDRLYATCEANKADVEQAFNKASHFDKGRMYHAYGTILKEAGIELLRDAKKEYMNAERRNPTGDVYSQLILLSADLKENVGTLQLYLKKFFALSPDRPGKIYNVFLDLQQESPAYAQAILDFICENYPSFFLAKIAQIKMQIDGVIHSGKREKAALKDLKAIKVHLDDLNIDPAQDDGSVEFLVNQFRKACVKLKVSLKELELPIGVPSLSAVREKRLAA